MKTKLITCLLAAVFLVATRSNTAIAQETDAKPAAEAKSDVKSDLQALVAKVRAKLQEDKKTEAALAEELKEFDSLLAKYKDQKTDDVAQILVMKAMLYVQVFDNTEKGKALLKQLKADFPETGPGKRVDDMLASIDKQEESEKIQRTLVEGATFPDFKVTGLDGKPLSIANYKGKPVLIDFWATWCGPCIAELPNVQAAYNKYRASGFEIIGISLDRDKDKLESFIKERDMTWPQFFDGKGWENELAQKYGVNSIPATYLLDGEGKIVATDLRGDDLETELAKLLAKK